MRHKVDGWEEVGKQERRRLKTPETNGVHTCKSLICEEQTEKGIKSKQTEKLETITSIYCEFKKLLKYPYAV